MLRGDISNETPPRIIVVIDVVVKSELVESKSFLKGTTVSRKVTGLNNAELSRLWNAAFNYGLSVELAAFADEGWSEENITKLMDKLDNRGGNPFNYSELFDSFHDLVGELPYRANLKAVIDLPKQVARYGSWGLELPNL